jgi:hypothetical protein
VKKYLVQAQVTIDVTKVIEADSEDDAVEHAETMNSNEWIESGDIHGEYVEIEDVSLAKPKKASSCKGDAK